MDKFEKLLNELLSCNDKTCNEWDFDLKLEPIEPEHKGDQHEIVVRYAVGREHEAKAYLGKDPKTDSYVLLHAAGKLIGEATGLDGTKVSQALVKCAVKIMMKDAVEKIYKKLEDIL